MINRTLIRLKVVQMLYSYLLTRSEFRLMPPPEKQSRDNRVAYALYLDLILLVLELSGYNVKNERTNPLSGINYNPRLSSTKMAKSLATDSDIRDVIVKGSSSIAIFDGVLASLYQKITSSTVFADYLKIKSPEIKDDVDLWTVIIKSIIAKDGEVLAAARTLPDFTQVGFDRAVSMAAETLANYSDTKTTLLNARRSLDASLAKSYELYHALLLLMVELTRTQADRLEAAKDKFVPSAEDLNPNLRFVNNKFIKAVQESAQIEAYTKQTPISWEQDIYMLRDLLDEILSSQIYKRYMEAPVEPSFEDDCELWRQLFRNVIVPSDALAEALESQSVHWNDDLDIMSTFVIKTIKQWIAAGSPAPGLLPMYKDDEDARFGSKLFTDAVANRELYRSYVDRFIDSTQWDPERLAFMDIVIMSVIISELINFPLIPVPVTLNEYIDIANRYSTPKSGQFINGVMYNVIKYLKEEGLIQK